RGPRSRDADAHLPGARLARNDRVRRSPAPSSAPENVLPRSAQARTAGLAREDDIGLREDDVVRISRRHRAVAVVAEIHAAGGVDVGAGKIEIAPIERGRKVAHTE